MSACGCAIARRVRGNNIVHFRKNVDPVTLYYKSREKNMIFFLRIIEAVFLKKGDFHYWFEDFVVDIIVIAVLKFFVHFFAGCR